MIRSPLLTGLLHPLSFLVLGLSVLAGLVSAWWLFPIGLLVWTMMVVNVARNPALRISHEMQRRQPLAKRFQRHFDRLERSQVSVFNTMSSAPSDVRKALRPVEAEIKGVVDEAYALCRRMTALENYRLVTQSQGDLQAEMRGLAEAIERSTDTAARREYEESRKAMVRRVDKLKTVSNQLDRVEAQLVGVSNEMDSVMTEVVRLQAAGSADAARHVPELVERMRREAAELREFDGSSRVARAKEMTSAYTPHAKADT